MLIHTKHESIAQSDSLPRSLKSGLGEVSHFSGLADMMNLPLCKTRPHEETSCQPRAPALLNLSLNAQDLYPPTLHEVLLEASLDEHLFV